MTPRRLAQLVLAGPDVVPRPGQTWRVSPFVIRCLYTQDRPTLATCTAIPVGTTGQSARESGTFALAQACEDPGYHEAVVPAPRDTTWCLPLWRLLPWHPGLEHARAHAAVGPVRALVLGVDAARATGHVMVLVALADGTVGWTPWARLAVVWSRIPETCPSPPCTPS